MKSIISFEIPDELREKLRLEAFNKKLNISALLRQIIEIYFESLENKNKN